MPRDYKHRAQPRQARARASGWAWLTAGFVLGAVSASLAWWQFLPAPGEGAWIGARPAAAGREPAKSDPAAPKPQFQFYTLLPSEVTEVVVPDEELESEPEPPAAPPRTGSPPAPAEPTRYLLQVASFRKGADAERMKAQLALAGYEADVQQVSSGGGSWHRVRVGPFVGRAALQRARDRLARQGHKGLVIQVR